MSGAAARTGIFKKENIEDILDIRDMWDDENHRI